MTQLTQMKHGNGKSKVDYPEAKKDDWMVRLRVGGVTYGCALFLFILYYTSSAVHQPTNVLYQRLPTEQYTVTLNPPPHSSFK
jgi:hypothetical protein